MCLLFFNIFFFPFQVSYFSRLPSFIRPREKKWNYPRSAIFAASANPRYDDLIQNQCLYFACWAVGKICCFLPPDLSKPTLNLYPANKRNFSYLVLCWLRQIRKLFFYGSPAFSLSRIFFAIFEPKCFHNLRKLIHKRGFLFALLFG